MVLYVCENCNKEFTRKSSYNTHINRKNPCVKKVIKENNKNINNANNPNQSKIIQNNPIIEYNNKKCQHCSKIFSSVPNLNKHLKNSCKIKKQKETDKELIFKQLLEENNRQNEEKITNIIKKHEETVTSLVAQVNKLKKNLKTLSKNNNNINNNNVINSNNTTNNTTNIINLVDFGKEDLTIVDKEEFIKILNNHHINGVKITEELIKAIHFNDKYPQLNNVYISDINRNKFMIVQDNKWTLTHIDQIPRVIDNAIQYSYNKNNELSKKYKDNKSVYSRLQTINKYTKLADIDHLNELIEEDANPHDIQRCKNFQSHLYNNVKYTLYNKKKL